MHPEGRGDDPGGAVEALPTLLASARGNLPAPLDPRLAVVIPCYNYERFVGRAIESVVSQGHTDCEIVVVDDGSTDGSWDVITGTGVRAYRIANAGAREACLFGVDHTRAPFVLFLDADDELAPGALDRIVAALDPEVSKLQFGLTRVDAEGTVLGPASPAVEDFRDREHLVEAVLRGGAYTSPPTSGNVFRRDLCAVLREADYDSFIDGTMLFAAPFLGDVVSISDELGRYRIHGDNDSGLGRVPDAATLRRDAFRFAARVDHLRDVLAAREQAAGLLGADEMFFYRERMYYAIVAAGSRRPTMREAAAVLTALHRLPEGRGTKLRHAALLVLVAVLPRRRAHRVFARRFSLGDRSARALLHDVFG